MRFAPVMACMVSAYKTSASCDGLLALGICTKIQLIVSPLEQNLA